MMRKLIERVARHAPVLARDGAGLLGAAMIAIGAGSIYEPAGWIVGGVMLLAGAFLSGRSAA